VRFQLDDVDAGARRRKRTVAGAVVLVTVVSVTRSSTTSVT
jgi:hypothetical protein